MLDSPVRNEGNISMFESYGRTSLTNQEHRGTMRLGEMFKRGWLGAEMMQELQEKEEEMTRGIPYTKGNESYPWNYQWYIQQIA